MNSYWNKNLELFEKRFPLLSSMLPKDTNALIKITEAKDGALTAEENGIPLHSKYSPIKEAQSVVSQFDAEKKDAAVFLSFGLGYGPVEFAKKYPSKTLVLVENDPSRFFTALSCTDWSCVFSLSRLILILGAKEKECAEILNKYKPEETFIIQNRNQSLHAKEYYEVLQKELDALRQKDLINTNTLEKFSKLWMKNSCKNLHETVLLRGVNVFFNRAENLPFLILAAGPSLKNILPHLKELNKKMVTVCVDTALHAVLKAGIQPDFIILVDPQFYCARHLEFLESPSSVLILESAVYPGVFRFNCREKIMCSSMFPIGQYFESKTGEKGKLGAGGSVTTTAWDFAQACGAKEIYIAGMDLGFPKKETHVKGSQFENESLCRQKRLGTTETDNVKSLITASPEIKKDYSGNSLLTDKKMSVFALWFEENCGKALLAGTKTFSLTPESLFINGIEPADLESVLSKKDITLQKNAFLSLLKPLSKEEIEKKEEEFTIIFNDFCENVDFLYETAKKGLSICQKALGNRLKAADYARELDEIDKKILNSRAKDTCALVFPTERQLKTLSKDIPDDKILKSFYLSRLIYKEVQKACTSIKEALKK